MLDRRIATKNCRMMISALCIELRPSRLLQELSPRGTRSRKAEAMFFFSSRRRHTSWNCDWSSDVCSSDLHDRQLPDGTIVHTSPTGHTYTTQAHGAAMFPTLATPTGVLALPHTDPAPARIAMMPRRKQTRAQDRQDRINAERRQRSELIAEEQRQHQAWLASIYKPPPF